MVVELGPAVYQNYLLELELGLAVCQNYLLELSDERQNCSMRMEQPRTHQPLMKLQALARW
jgi:hypothetical protein